MKKDPIYHLAEKVQQGKITPRDALDQVASKGFLAQVDIDAIFQLDGRIRKLSRQNLRWYTILAVLNCQAARYQDSDILWGNCNFTLAWLYLKQDELEVSLRYHQVAAKVLKPIPSVQKTVALVRLGMGEIREYQGDLDTAASEYQTASAMGRELEQPQIESDAQSGLGRVYLAMGKVDAALQAFGDARELSRDNKDPRGEETAQGNFGLANHFLGQLTEAEKHYQKAIALGRKIDHETGTGRHLNNFGNVLIDLGKLKKAKECFVEALDIARRHHDRQGKQQCLGNLGNLYQAKAKREANPRVWLIEAIQYHQQAVAIARERKDRLGQATHLLNQGRAYRKLECFEKAQECYVQALSWAKGQGRSAVNTQWRIHYAWGNLCVVQLQDQQQAFDHYEAAIEIVESQRYHLKTELRTMFWQERVALYKRMALCCLRLQEEAKTKEEQDDLWLALVYTEWAKTRYLADLLGPRDSLPDGTRQTILSTIKKLPEHTGVVVFNVTEFGTVVFVVTNEPMQSESTDTGWQVSRDGHIRARLIEGFDHDTLQHILIEVDDAGEIVGGYLGDYHRYVDCRKDDARFAELYQRWTSRLNKVRSSVYEDLLASVDRELSGLSVNQIVFMPNLGLGLLPLHACGIGQGCLWDDYEITYAPSFDVLDHCQKQTHSDLLDADSLLAVSNPTGNLIWAEDEVAHIAEFFPKPCTKKILDSGKKENERATVEAIKRKAHAYAFIHFASHGKFNLREPFQSILKLAKSELLTLETIFEHVKLPRTRLVVMSACETGLIDPGDLADEYIGLPAGFIKAGVPAVVSSLWVADDLSTALLMECFYHNHLNEGLRPSQALQAAQRWLRTVDRPFVIRRFQLLLADLAAQHERMSPLDEETELVRKQIQQLEKLHNDLLDAEKRDPGGRPFDHPHYWAAFTVSGANVAGRE